MAKYNVWITLKKFGIVAVEVFIAGAFAYWANEPFLLVIAPFLEAIRNFLKNYQNKK
jgi:hypothetical protein